VASTAQPVTEQRGVVSLLAQKYCCETCGVRFAWLSNLRRHERKHANESLLAGSRCHYQCSYCGRVFSRAASLQKHITRHVEPAELQQPLYHCRQCGQRFVWKQSLSRHLRNAHSSLSSAHRIPVVTAASTVTGSVSAIASSAPVQSDCVNVDSSRDSRDTTDQSGLSSGTEPVHSEVQCSDAMISSSLTGRPLDKSARPLVPCPHCGFAFFWRSNLTRHIRQQHVADKPSVRDCSSQTKHLQCTRCRRQFSRLRHLQVHLQVSMIATYAVFPYSKFEFCYSNMIQILKYHSLTSRTVDMVIVQHYLYTSKTMFL